MRLFVLFGCCCVQVSYFITCRFLKTSTFHPRLFRGNKMIYVSVPITLALMVSEPCWGVGLLLAAGP